MVAPNMLSPCYTATIDLLVLGPGEGLPMCVLVHSLLPTCGGGQQQQQDIASANAL